MGTITTSFIFCHTKFATLHKLWCPTVNARHDLLLYLSLNKTNSLIDFGAAYGRIKETGRLKHTVINK